MSDTEAGPHPNKEAVNSTNLKTVSFSSLLNGNESVASELLQAAVQDGFFYLDLHHAETQPLLDAVENLYKLNDNLFSLDQQSLMKYDLDVIGPSKIDGYKPAGRNTGVAAGKKDGFEIYLISTNKLLGLESSDSLPFPETITHQRHMVDSVVEKSHWIGSVIMTHLSSALQLNYSASLQASHRYGKPSTSALGLLRYPAVSQAAIGKLGQTAHTDVGSITAPGLALIRFRSRKQPPLAARMPHQTFPP